MKLRGTLIGTALPIAAAVSLSAAAVSALTLYYVHRRTLLTAAVPVDGINAVMLSEENDECQHINSASSGDALEKPCQAAKRPAQSEGTDKMSNSVDCKIDGTVICDTQKKNKRKLRKSCSAPSKPSVLPDFKQKQKKHTSTTSNATSSVVSPTCRENSKQEIAPRLNSETEEVAHSSAESLRPNTSPKCNCNMRQKPGGSNAIVRTDKTSSILVPRSSTSMLKMTQPTTANLIGDHMIEQRLLQNLSQSSISKLEKNTEKISMQPSNGVMQPVTQNRSQKVPRNNSSKAVLKAAHEHKPVTQNRSQKLPRNNSSKAVLKTAHEDSAAFCTIIGTKPNDSAEGAARNNSHLTSKADFGNVLNRTPTGVAEAIFPVASGSDIHLASQSIPSRQPVENPMPKNISFGVSSRARNKELSKSSGKDLDGLSSSAKSGVRCNTNGWPANRVHLSWVVFWDIENVSIPKKMPASRFVCTLRKFLSSCRGNGLIDPVLRITVVSNPNRMSGEMRAQLHSSGVTVVQVQTRTRKDVSDKALLTDLCLLPLHTPPPLGVALLSGDVDFSYAIARLTALTYHTVVVAPDNSCSSLLANAPTRVVPLSLLLKEGSCYANTSNTALTSVQNRTYQRRQRQSNFRKRLHSPHPVREPNFNSCNRKAKKSNRNQFSQNQKKSRLDKGQSHSPDLATNLTSQTLSHNNEKSNIFCQCPTRLIHGFDFGILSSTLQSCFRWPYILILVIVSLLSTASLFICYPKSSFFMTATSVMAALKTKLAI